MRGKKLIENMLIIILLAVVVIFLTPIIQKIIVKAQLSAVTTSVSSLVSGIRNVYYNQSMYTEVKLPLTIVFEDSEYTVYMGTDSEVFDVDIDLSESGQTPISGKIVLDTVGNVSVTDLEYSHYICSQAPNSEVSCTLKDETE